ncbi:MAG TPA: hypothetical protein VFP59_17970 [Candidatus Angelobacter sp.]|nr:hypothetical protein [Candidatus Angelobacter sp.]
MTSIKSMAGMLHPPSAKSRVIVSLRAYFDESGTHWSGPNACDVFVLCGYLGTESLWDDRTPTSFWSKWTDVMHGKPFHATEMESNPQGPIVKPMLANVVRKSGVIGIGGGIHIPSYNRLLLPHIQKQKGVDNPYLFLFADVICEAVRSSAMFIGEDQSEPIGFVFASHKKWSIEAHEMYDKLKQDPETPDDVRCRMGPVAFDDMEKFIPLQASDHLAFETYHLMNDPPGTSRPTMNILTNWQQNNGRFYNEHGIQRYIAKMQEAGLF